MNGVNPKSLVAALQIPLGATYLKLVKVADEVPPILSNFLCGTMCEVPLHALHGTVHTLHSTLYSRLLVELTASQTKYDRCVKL